jgi:DHA2 family lincomycin resistance protein-like MFS transporter
VPPHLYSHGSAILGTIQQVGGAAGTALLIAVLTLQSTALAAGGAGVDAAQAGGIRAAFVAGAIISLFAVAGSVFLRKPADAPSEAPLAH